MSGILYIVATPIGNLNDVTTRALEILKTVDFILAEDTRVTLRLLNHYGIATRTISYHEHSSEQKDQKIIEELENGSSYALVSDAGTPAISDPGAKLVALAVEKGIEVIPVPGVSAVTTIASIAGFRSPYLHFWGFFPQKKKTQNQMIEYCLTIPGLHVFFESPFRVRKTLALFAEHPLTLVVGRELTKQFETIYRGDAASILSELTDATTRGEFVIAVHANAAEDR